MTKQLKVLIDCDPGHDDAVAIMMASAHRERFDILGITTIAGNQTLANVTNNAKQIMEHIGENIPVASGQETPLIKRHAVELSPHGSTGMDGPDHYISDYPLASTNATQFLYEKIMACDEQVTILALGPLTNIALLFKVFPEVLPKIEQISLMGGGINKGNATAAAEFNIYIDPEAAKIVFESGVKIIMAGLDVTEDAWITIPEFTSLKGQGPISQYTYELMEYYNASGAAFGFLDTPLHDACSVAYLIDPSLFESVQKQITVVTDECINRGQTLADNRATPRSGTEVTVLMDVQREKFIDMFFRSIATLEERNRK